MKKNKKTGEQLTDEEKTEIVNRYAAKVRKREAREETLSEVLPVIISAVVTFLLAVWMFYVGQPAINLTSIGFWGYIIVIIVLFVIISLIMLFTTNGDNIETAFKISGITLGIVLIVFGILLLSGSELFNAKKYSKLIKVTDGQETSIPSVKRSSSIALMDTESAKILGNREVGSLTNVVSQYELDDYTQINYKNKPYKVGALNYGGLFKWKNNRSAGVPGYVIVDPVSFEGEYIRLNEGMKYVPSAFFSENLERHIRSEYPTLIYRNLHFEIDEEGNPYYVAATIKKTIGLFSGDKVTGCIVVDPVSGEIKRYSSKKIPNWVDVVYDGDLICEQFNYSAQLQNGFWNSVVGQKGCRKVTEYEDSSKNNKDEDEESSRKITDYGYIAKDNDVFIYTGVTSVNKDSSNLGFIIANERTGKTQFIECAGADEFSAMSSAEGEVQEKGYKASFPSLVDVDGTPSYIMVLKDNSGIVKLYACVNVKQYSQVATAVTQEECLDKYKALLKGNISVEDAVNEEKTISDDEKVEEDESSFKDKTITVKHLEKIDQDGNTYLYIVDADNKIYYAKYEDVMDMLLVKEGDQITIKTDGEKFKYTR